MDLSEFKGKSVLVTGGTGLIGRAVTKIILEAGARVLTVSLDNVESIYNVRGDLALFDFCRQMTRDKDYVFHLAGVKGSVEVTKSKPASFFVPLLQMNTNVLEACRLNGVKKVVYTSSIGAYASAEVFKEGVGDDGPPMDEYPGWAKRMAEKQIQAYREQYRLDYSVVRPCNVYGPGDNFDPKNAMVIPSLMARIAAGENPLKVWGDGSAVRDFCYSEDVAEGVILAIQKGTNGYVNLGGGDGITIRDLVETMASFVPFEYKVDASKASGYSKRVMDITKAKDTLGWYPKTSLRDGLIKTWEWFTENPYDYLKRKNYFTEGETK